MIKRQPSATNSPASEGRQEDITVKDIIFTVQAWFHVVWPFRGRIMLLSISVSILTFLHSSFYKYPEYSASYQLIFKDEGAGINSAMRLASSFGLIGASGGGVSNSRKTQEFLTSRSNFAYALTENIQGGRLIDRYYASIMENNDVFRLQYESNFGINERYTDSIITQLHQSLNTEVVNMSYDEESGILTVKVTYEDESFVYDFCNLIVLNTEHHFLNDDIRNGQTAVKMFKEKVDSIEVNIDATLRKLGQFKDQNRSVISSLDKISETRLMIDLEMLKISYGEYIKGLEMAKAELVNLEPPFMYFDRPTYPLTKENKSVFASALLAFSFSFFLFSIILIARAELNKIMS